VLLTKYYLGDQIKKDVKGGGGYVALMGERRGTYWVLVGKPEGKRLLGRTRRRLEDNIKMDLQEVGWGTWTGLMWLRIGTGGRVL
jgi:hypothetical protein